MPFVQMENISLFLRACQAPPLSLPPHDVFLTIDLYEAKDPAQVLQCLGAFSRRAHSLQPAKFPRSIGAIKSKGGVMSPQLTGSSQGYGGTPSRARGISNVSESSPLSFNSSTNLSRSGPISPAKSGPALSPKPAISSWSKKSDEENTAPAWNIHQYGYMGGASQGNQGISFGARRQITSPAPPVPSLAEKERLGREAELEQAKRQKELEAEEKRAKLEEERLWREETERLREQERRKVEEEKKQWDEERRRWEEEERRRLNEEKATRQRLETERHNKRTAGDVRLNGQFLSQYQAVQKSADSPSTEIQRVKELERELELAKERERQYERERLDLQEKDIMKARPRSRSRPRMVQPSFDLTSQEEERKLIRSEWQSNQSITAEIDEVPPPKPPRPLPEPSSASSPRPLPDPAAYANKTRENRAERFLSSNHAPVSPEPTTHQPQDYSSTAEIDTENSRRIASTQKTRAGGWASKTLLEREMERERERQREWEESQKQTQEAVKLGLKDNIGIGPGQGAWDVHQYGFVGGDNQNRGGPGLGIGGARRQIIGPRPRP